MMDLANLSNDQLRHLPDSDEPPTPPCTRKQIRVTLEERRAEEYKQRVDESEARAATAEGKNRNLKLCMAHAKPVCLATFTCMFFPMKLTPPLERAEHNYVL